MEDYSTTVTWVYVPWNQDYVLGAFPHPWRTCQKEKRFLGKDFLKEVQLVLLQYRMVWEAFREQYCSCPWKGCAMYVLCVPKELLEVKVSVRKGSDPVDFSFIQFKECKETWKAVDKVLGVYWNTWLSDDVVHHTVETRTENAKALERETGRSGTNWKYRGTCECGPLKTWYWAFYKRIFVFTSDVILTDSRKPVLELQSDIATW